MNVAILERTDRRLELREPRAALDQAGATTTLFAPKEGQIHSMKHHDKVGTSTVISAGTKQIRPQFDAVLCSRRRH